MADLQEQESGIPPGDDDQGPLTQMIIQTDRALTSIAQVLAKASPEAGRALAQISAQYRDIISGVMQQGAQQQPSRGAPQMASPETQGRPSMQAY